MFFLPFSKGVKLIARVVFLALAAAWIPTGAQSAMPREQDYWKLLRNKFEHSAQLYAGALLEEFGIFRDLYPGCEKADSLEYLVALLYESEKMEARAIANFLKILYLYPASPLKPEVLQNLKRLAERRPKGIKAIFADDNLNLLKTHVLKVVEDSPTFAGGAAGYLDFLQLVADTRIKDLARYTIHECEHYLYSLGYDLQADRVMLIRGDMYRLLKQWRSAILSYRTAELLNPYGEAIPQALINIGNVYFRRLENNKLARLVFQETIDKFPADPEAARASILIAEIDQAEGNYAQAVVQLEDTAKRFPFPEMRMEAYARIGKIYLDHLEDPEKAVAFYERVVSEFPQEIQAAEALIAIGGIHEKKTKDYAAAVEAYSRLAELFPGNPLAPRYLLAAAELAEEKLKDPDLALTLYEQLAKGYPETDPGKKAAKALEKKR